MTWIKLCGLRSVEDVEVAAAAGADAIGLVSATRSPRFLPIERVRELAAIAPIESYLVTEGLDVDEALDQAELAAVDGIQPHGRHARATADAALRSGLLVLLPVGSAPDLSAVDRAIVPIVDGPSPGSGAALEWSAVHLDRPFVLAGGLTPANVAEAIASTGAYGVDVSSGIESEPGVKDHDLMRQFVAAAR